MNSFVIHVTIIMAFYIIGAYATTDILRLLKGSSLSVWEPYCYCVQCGTRIALRDQVPVIGYVLSCGKCRRCKRKILFSNLFLEIFLFSFMTVIAVYTKFSWIGYCLCLCLYESTKVYFLVKTGRRKNKFILNIMFSLLSNIVIFSFLAFLFSISHLGE